MIELRPSAEPVAGDDEEKADDHIYSSLREVEAPFCVRLFDPFIDLVYEGDLSMGGVDFLEVITVDENGGASDEGDLLIDFEFDHVFLVLEFNLVDKM